MTLTLAEKLEMENDALYDEQSKLEQQLFEAYAKITEIERCGNCKQYITYDFENIGCTLIINGEKSVGCVPITAKCDKWGIRK